MSSNVTKSEMPVPEIFSNEVQELISYQPNSLIRRGNFIIFIIILLILSFTWFIKYPDLIKCNMKLTAINAPKLLTAKKEGMLVGLLVNNEQIVNAGQPLAFLQSTANHQQVVSLYNLIKRIIPLVNKGNLNRLGSIKLPLFYELGELQSAYQDFQTSYTETIQVLGQGFYQKKKNALQKDQEFLSSIRNNSLRQLDLIKQDYDLTAIEYRANESLAMDKVIAPLELNQDKSKILSKKQILEQTDAQLLNNSLIEQNKKKEILELQKYIDDQEKRFYSALFILKSKTEEWMQEYVISAPENGKIFYTSFLQKNQLLTVGQELFYLQPEQTSFYGQMKAPQTGFGKIKIGQKVIIDVTSYPSYEYGRVMGTINYISNMPTESDSFLIKVALDNGLETNFHKKIYFRNNLSAEAKVVTNSRRLSDRFLGQLADLIRR